MGVYIKGMEMPKKCKECYDKGICYHIHRMAYCPLCGEIENPSSYVLTGAKHSDCPLVPVPPHGRLIDADALIKDGWTLHKEVIRMGGYATHELPLNNPSIPTIIEAEVKR